MIRQGVAAIDWENEADRHAREKEDNRMIDSTVATPVMITEEHEIEDEMPGGKGMVEDELTKESEQQDDEELIVDVDGQSSHLDEKIDIGVANVAAEVAITAAALANREDGVKTVTEIPNAETIEIAEVAAQVAETARNIPDAVVEPIVTAPATNVSFCASYLILCLLSKHFISYAVILRFLIFSFSLHIRRRD
jgi:hypothetical protein